MASEFKGLANKDKNRIIGYIRTAFKVSDLYQAAKKLRRVERKEGYYKNGNPIIRVYYRCDSCKSLEKSVDIDHIKRVGGFSGSFDSYVQTVWCMGSGGLDNLQGLCKECHGAKTTREKEEDRRSKAKTRHHHRFGVHVQLREPQQTRVLLQRGVLLAPHGVLQRPRPEQVVPLQEEVTEPSAFERAGSPAA